MYFSEVKSVVALLALDKKKTYQKVLVQSAGAAEYTDCFFGYDAKQSYGETLVMLEIWGMRSTYLLPSFPGSPLE